MEFREFPKIARFSREVVVTEKIDGSNAQIAIAPAENQTFDGWDQRPDGDAWYHDFSGQTFAKANGVVYALKAGGRNQWIWRGQDNFGFARWVEENAAELVKLGEGRHYGEWWGSGIRRGYGLPKGEKRFSLFNVARWADRNATGIQADENVRFVDLETKKWAPACCRVVPIIWRGEMDDMRADMLMGLLAHAGSRAAPGFMRPEGIVIFHAQGNVAFKKTFEKDEAGKGREPVASELTRAA